jgi:hypothetical protein
MIIRQNYYYAVFLDCLFAGFANRKDPSRPIRFVAAAALEALISLAEFVVSLICMICLHSIALVCFVTSDNATSCRAQNSMVPGIMARHATNGRTFKAALCFR